MRGLLFAVAAILLGGIAYYFITLSLYEPLEDLFDFPVPKNAELVRENAQGKSYGWSKASEEHGIPYGYELALQANGWKKGEREGASVIYTKGDKKIDLTSTTKLLNIRKGDN